MKVGYLDSIIQRIPIRKPCKGYYLRWYYNGWHYWFFLPGEMNMETVGEAYRTTGTRKISIGSGQLTYSQAQAIRTILLTREIYLLTADGWKNIRIEPSSVITLENMVNGYEMEFVMIIGSKEISYETGYTPVPIIPVIDPIPDPGACEVIIGTQVWACKNYDSNYPGSRVYVDDEYFRDLFGGLYTYNQVMASGFVPPGWHVPTIAEWQTLIAFVGGSGVAGGKLKEAGYARWLFPNTGAVDTYGFSAVGGGRYNSITKVYELIGYEGWLWTSDELPSGYANAVIMTNTNDNAYPIGQLMNNYISVRLIKDTAPATAIVILTSMVGVFNVGLQGVGQCTIDWGFGEQTVVTLTAVDAYYPHVYAAGGMIRIIGWENITHLLLGSDNISKIIIPPEAVNLERLVLSDNDLTEVDIPAELVNLWMLTLDFNALTSFTTHPEWTELIYFYLDNNLLTAVDTYPTWTKLRSFFLEVNQLTAVETHPEWIALRNFTLQTNQITVLVTHPEWVLLNLFSVADNPISALVTHPEWVALTQLHWYNTSITTITIHVQWVVLLNILASNNDMIDPAVINHILIICDTVNIARFGSGTCWLEGGTNAAPTGAGIIAKNNLIANGANVLTN